MNIDKILHKLLRYGLLLAVFVPLVIFRNNFSPFNFGKVIVFRTLIEILFVIYVALAIKYPRFRPPNLVSSILYLVSRIKKSKIQNTKYQIPNTIFLALTLFTASMVLSAFAGVNWYKSFWGGGWERMGGLFSWLHYYAFFIMLISVFRKKEDWLNILWLSVFAALISSFYGFLQKGESLAIVGAAAERARILGTLGNPAALAGYLLFNFYFALYLFSHHKSRGVKTVLIIAGLVFATAIFMTAVRGAVLALAGSLFLLGLVWVLRNRKKTAFILFAAVMAIFCLVFATLVPKSETLKRLTDFSLQSETIKNRLIVWQVGLEGIKEKPLLGWGPENFESVFSLYYDPAISKGSGTNIFDRAHNVFIDTAASQGLLGLAAFILLWLGVVCCIKYQVLSIKQKNILYALMFAYFVHNFFFFDLSSTYVMLIILFGLVSVTSGEGEGFDINSTASQSKKPPEISLRTSQVLILPVILIMGMLVYWANIKPALANYYSTRGLIAFDSAKRSSGETFLQKYNEGVNYFKKALGLADWLKSDVLRKFSELYIDTAIISEGKILEEDLKRESEFLLKNLAGDKKRRSLEFSSYIYEYKTERLLALYINPGLFNDVKAKQLEAIKKFPMVIELYYDLADSNFYLKNYTDVINAYEGAYKLNPSVLESQFGLGQAYILYAADKTRREEGMALLSDSIKNGYLNPQKFDWLGKSLEKDKKYKEMAEIFGVLAEKYPEYNIQLAYSHLLLGKKEKAREAANKAFLLPLNSRQNQMLLEILRRIK